MVYEDFEIGDVLYDKGDGKTQPKYLLVTNKDEYTKFVYCRIGHKNSTGHGYKVDIGGGIVVDANDSFTLILDPDLDKPHRRDCMDYQIYMRDKKVANKLERVSKLLPIDMYAFWIIESYSVNHPNIEEMVMIKLRDLPDDMKSLLNDFMSLESEIKNMQNKQMSIRDQFVEGCYPSLEKTDRIKMPGCCFTLK